VGGDGFGIELAAGEGVLAGGFKTVFGSAENAPADAEAGLVEALESGAETAGIGEHVGAGDAAIGEGEAGGEGGAHGELAVEVGGGEARGVALEEEAVDAVGSAGEDDGEVGDAAVGDPGFFAVEDEVIAVGGGGGGHAGGVGTEAGFGEAEGADEAARGELGEVFAFLLVGAEGEDGEHDEGALDGGEGAEAGVAALEFFEEEAVFDVGHAGKAVAVEVGAEEAHFAEGGDDLGGEGGGREGFADEGLDLFGDEAAGGGADELFFVGELGIDVEEVRGDHAPLFYGRKPEEFSGGGAGEEETGGIAANEAVRGGEGSGSGEAAEGGRGIEGGEDGDAGGGAGLFGVLEEEGVGPGGDHVLRGAAMPDGEAGEGGEFRAAVGEAVEAIDFGNVEGDLVGTGGGKGDVFEGEAGGVLAEGGAGETALLFGAVGVEDAEAVAGGEPGAARTTLGTEGVEMAGGAVDERAGEEVREAKDAGEGEGVGVESEEGGGELCFVPGHAGDGDVARGGSGEGEDGDLSGVGNADEVVEELFAVGVVDGEAGVDAVGVVGGEESAVLEGGDAALGEGEGGDGVLCREGGGDAK